MMIGVFQKIVLSAALVAVLAGCENPETQAALTFRTVESVKLERSTAYKRLTSLPAVEIAGTMGVAAEVVTKCDRIEASEEIGPLIRPFLNRLIFSSRAKTRAAAKAKITEYDAKYGRSIIGSNNLCDVADREIAEESSMSAFWVRK